MMLVQALDGPYRKRRWLSELLQRLRESHERYVQRQIAIWNYNNRCVETSDESQRFGK